MHKNLIASATLLAVLSTSFSETVQAQDFYVTAVLGTTQGDDVKPHGNIGEMPEVKDDNELSYALGLGTQLSQNVRIETRLTKRSNDTSNSGIGFSPLANADIAGTSSGKLDSLALSLEGFYDFNNNSAFTPYLKAAIGVAKNKFSANLEVPAFQTTFYYGEESTNEFIWSLGAGAHYKINQDILLFVEYQYGNLGEVTTKRDDFGDRYQQGSYEINDFNLGIRFSF